MWVQITISNPHPHFIRYNYHSYISDAFQCIMLQRTDISRCQSSDCVCSDEQNEMYENEVYVFNGSNGDVGCFLQKGCYLGKRIC